MTDTSVSSLASASASSKVESTSAAATKLTATTKTALQALGVDTTNITTEAQGQVALLSAKAKAEAAKKANAPDHASMDGIMSQVKALASQVGVTVAEKEKPEDVIAKISSKITELRSSAGDDKAKLAEINNYQAQLASISSTLSSTKAAQSQLSGSMSGLASMNKIYQNLT